VAWITERKNVLSTFFYLSAILAYLCFLKLGVSASRHPSSHTPRSQASSPHHSQWGYYALALTLYLCALLSKTVACSMPAALLLLLWWKRDRISWHTALPLIPYFVVGAALGLVTVWMEKNRVGAQGEEWAFSLLERCLIAGRALWFYAGKLLWPHELIFIYPRWQIDAGVWWQYLFPLAAIALFTTLWLFRRQIGKAPLVAVLFFTGTLFPALGFFDVYPMRFSFVADHFQYLASVGVIVVCVAFFTTFLQRLSPPTRTVGYVAYGILLLLLGMRVWQQGYMYKDVETLWRVTIAKNPTAWIAHTNLGAAYAKLNQFEEAKSHFAQAVRWSPKNLPAYNSLIDILVSQDKFEEAVAVCRRALWFVPDNALLHCKLGTVLGMQGRRTEALEEIHIAARLDPNAPEIRDVLQSVSP